jgi:hypothetical protein
MASAISAFVSFVGFVPDFALGLSAEFTFWPSARL